MQKEQYLVKLRPTLAFGRAVQALADLLLVAREAKQVCLSSLSFGWRIDSGG